MDGVFVIPFKSLSFYVAHPPNNIMNFLIFLCYIMSFNLSCTFHSLASHKENSKKNLL